MKEIIAMNAELLAACKAALPYLSDEGGTAEPLAHEQVESAIAKADRILTPIQRLFAVMERNQFGNDSNQWFGFSTEFFSRLEEAMHNQWAITQAEIARMAEDAESDANAKAGSGEYRVDKRIENTF